ncbi:MAG: LPD38 domain-containing protein [Rhodospirillaceae bacterium]
MPQGIPKWDEIAATEKFKALPADEREFYRGAYFDQYIAPTVAPEAVGGARQQWDDLTKVKPQSAMRRVGDVGVDLAKGTVGFGESAVGILDLISFGAAGEGLAAIGYDPKRTKDALSSLYSNNRQAANQNVADAKGFVDTAYALVENPSALAGAVTEAIPGTLGIAGVGRMVAMRAYETAFKAAEVAGLGAEAAKQAGIAAVKSAIPRILTTVSAAEGAQAAGSIAEQARQEGQPWADYVLPATAAGVGTAAIGRASGAIASKIGLGGDLETGIATAGLADGAANQAGGIISRAAKGFAREGVLEEMPQSAQEQAFTNVALGNPAGEGVAGAAASGLMVGGAMGGFHAGIAGQDAPAAEPVEQTVAKITAAQDADSAVAAATSSLDSALAAPTQEDMLARIGDDSRPARVAALQKGPGTPSVSGLIAGARQQPTEIPVEQRAQAALERPDFERTPEDLIAIRAARQQAESQAQPLIIPGQESQPQTAIALAFERARQNAQEAPAAEVATSAPAQEPQAQEAAPQPRSVAEMTDKELSLAQRLTRSEERRAEIAAEIERRAQQPAPVVDAAKVLEPATPEVADATKNVADATPEVAQPVAPALPERQEVVAPAAVSGTEPRPVPAPAATEPPQRTDTPAVGAPASQAQAGGQSLADIPPSQRPARTDRIGDQMAARAREEAGREASTQAARDDTDGFADQMTPPLRRKAIEALNVNRLFDGELLTRKEGVRRAVAQGATITQGKEGRRLMKPDGAFLAERDISKTAMDYAAHLIAAKSQAPAVQVDKTPLILGKPVTDLTPKQLQNALKTGSDRVKAVAQAELDRRDLEKQAKAGDSPSLKLLRAIAGFGGVNIQHASDISGEKNPLKLGGLRGRIFRKDGLGIDDVATYLHERGWISDAEYADADGGVQRARDLIRDAIDGRLEPILPADVESNMRQEEAARALAEAQEEAVAEGLPGTPEQAATVEELTEALAVLSPDEIERFDALAESMTDAEWRAAVVKYAKEKRDADQRGNAQDVERGEAAGAEAPRAPSAEQPAEEIALTGETEEEIAAREAAEKQAAADKAAAEKAAEEKAQADAERDSFALTGSDRVADVAAAGGQQDLLAPAQPANPLTAAAAALEQAAQAIRQSIEPKSEPNKEPIAAERAPEQAAEPAAEQPAQPKPEEGPMFAREKRGPARHGMTVAQLQAEGAETISKFTVPVVIHESPQAAGKKAGIDVYDDAIAFAHDGKIHAIASAIPNPMLFEAAMWHEGTHIGLHLRYGRMSQAYKAAIDRVVLANKGIREAAKAWREQYGADKAEAVKKANRRLTDNEIAEVVRYSSYEEALAEMSEQRKGKPMKFVEQLALAMQRLMRAMGLNRLAGWMESRRRLDDQGNPMFDEDGKPIFDGTNAEALALLQHALGAVTKPGMQLRVQNATAYMRGIMNEGGQDGFWQNLKQFAGRIRAGSATGSEIAEAYAGRDRVGQSAKRAGYRAAADPDAMGQEVILWNDRLAGFDGYITVGAWRDGGLDLSVIPLDLARNIPAERLYSAAVASENAITTLSLTSRGDNAYEVSVSEPDPGTPAYRALEEKGAITPTTDTDIAGRPYSRVNIGDVAMRRLLTELVRRYAVAKGQAPALEIPRRDTGANKERARSFTPEQVEAHFSRSQTRSEGRVTLSPDERAYFESIFANEADLADLHEQVPSARMDGGALVVDAADASGLEDYVADTWASAKKEYGGEGAKSLPKSFASGGNKFAEKLRAAMPDSGAMFKRGVEVKARESLSWDAAEPTPLDNFIYKLQDRQIDTKRVLQAIREAGKEIADEKDVYLQEELYHGRAAKQTQDFIDKELKPLVSEMAMRKVEMGEFQEYLHARHAEERNAQIAKINEDMPDGGSGMTNAEAQEYFAKLDPKKRAAFEALAKRVDAITAATRRTLIDYGLESADTIKAWGDAYEHYVPLYREDLESTPGTGQGFSVRGPASKRAMGSKRAVVDILANIAMQRERAIVRGEKNRVANALIGLAKDNPRPDFWQVDRPPTIRYVDPRTGLVTEAIDPLHKSRDNVVVARIPDAEGKIIEHTVTFNEADERAMRMAHALKNLDMDQLGEVLGTAAKITRYFSSINTQYNPVFGVVNILRDTQGALFNLSTTPLQGKQKEVLQNTVSALRGIYIDLRDVRAGKEATSSWASLWEEFQREGGQTGYRDMFRTSKDRAEAIEREIRRVGEGKAKNFGRAVFDWFSDYNTAMENAVRLAAYKAAKDMGVTNQRAASIAKNLTVNFNRKGQAATQVGALYAFFNASVQGTARLAETLSGPMGRKIIAGGITLGAMQALWLAAAGFDDDEPPQFVRERALIIPIGDKKYLTIPMPLGFHVIPNIGRMGVEFVLSGFRDPAKRITDFVGMFTDAFNPVGNAGLSLQTIAPTIVDPLAALAENRDWTGKPIARENFNSLRPTPGHTRAKDTASEFSKAISKALNWMSGGTNYQPGIFSPTPDQIDYLIGQATGGLGREAIKLEQTVTSTMTGEELPTYKIPLLGRFYGSSEGQAPQGSAFYANLKTIHQHEAEIKGRRKAGEPVVEYLRDNPEARLVRFANHAERVVSDLRRKKRELLEKGAPQASIRLIDERITVEMRRLNERVRALREREAA